MKSLLFLTFTIFLFSLAGFYVVVTTVTPIHIQADQLGLFYLVFWLTVTSLFTLLIFRFRGRGTIRQFGQSLRQAGLIGSTVVLGLVLQSFRLLSVLNAGALIVGMLLIELLCRSTDRLHGGRV